MTSWVIVNKETGEAVFETFNWSIADKINRARYRVESIQNYLGRTNASIKAFEIY
jgi:hypothetical protein